MGVYDFEPTEYNLKLAEALKKVLEFKKPEWVDFVKSGPSKERPIEDPDFWHKRSASVLRQIYKMGSIGVSKLRTRYGSKKNKGYAPERFKKSGGKIIRVILQQADKAGLTEQVKAIKGKRKAGRQLTETGRNFMENIK